MALKTRCCCSEPVQVLVTRTGCLQCLWQWAGSVFSWLLRPSQPVGVVCRAWVWCCTCWCAGPCLSMAAACRCCAAASSRAASASPSSCPPVSGALGALNSVPVCTGNPAPPRKAGGPRGDTALPQNLGRKQMENAPAFPLPAACL